MKVFQEFTFVNYRFGASQKLLTLEYAIDDTYRFQEQFRFDFECITYDPVALDRACQLLFFMAGISYYKMFVPRNIGILTDKPDGLVADFLAMTWQRGLGEFFYVNKLDPRTPISFPAKQEENTPVHTKSKGLLVGIGGGKDSLVSVELLQKADLGFATWSLNHRTQLSPLVERIGSTHYFVERSLDPKMSEMNAHGALNGHIPISAIFACVGTIVAILTGNRDSIVSNEQSANEPTLYYEGVAINHQYSKSQEFERSYQAVIRHAFGDSQRYYSLLRPLSELRIAELFAQRGFDTYHDVFSSCNHAFTLQNDRMFWDGSCPKCAFVFLALTPFVDRQKLVNIFGGKNLLLDPALQPTYRRLLGIEGDKPLECVGEIQESRAAMRLAQKFYPNLTDAYTFDLAEDYDFRALHNHAIPQDMWNTIQSYLQQQWRGRRE